MFQISASLYHLKPVCVLFWSQARMWTAWMWTRLKRGFCLKHICACLCKLFLQPLAITIKVAKHMVVVVLCRLLHLNVDAQTCSMHAQVCPVLLIMLPNGRTAGRGESETSQCSHAVAVRRRRTKACQSLFCCVFFFSTCLTFVEQAAFSFTCKKPREAGLGVHLKTSSTAGCLKKSA